MIEKKISNFRKICNYYGEVNAQILARSIDPYPPMPEIRYTSAAQVGLTGSGSTSVPRPNTTSVMASGNGSIVPPLLSSTSIKGLPISPNISTHTSKSVLLPLQSASTSKLPQVDSKKQLNMSAISIAAAPSSSSKQPPQQESELVRDEEEVGEEDLESGIFHPMQLLEQSTNSLEQDIVVNVSANRIALSSINKNTVRLTQLPVSELPAQGIFEDSSVEEFREEVIDSLEVKINHKHHIKQENVFHQRSVDIVHIRSQYPCMNWRNHDMILKLTSSTNWNELTDIQKSICEQYHMVRGTKSKRVSIVLGKKSYFNESKTYVIRSEIHRKEPVWEEELRRRKEDVRIFDGRIGGLRPIKPLLDHVEVRKQQFAAEISKLHEDKY